MSGPCTGVVSIQRDDLGDAVSRHVSFGILVDDDVVVVPGPLGWLHDLDVTFEVLIASKRNNQGGFVERIRVRSAEILGLAAEPSGSIGVLHLERPAKHRPDATPVDMNALERMLAAQSDVFAAFERSGSDPSNIRDMPVEDVLGPVAEWERARRSTLVRGRLGDPAETTGRICCLIVSCPKCFVCSGPWW